jgi:hypothetical protein
MICTCCGEERGGAEVEKEATGMFCQLHSEGGMRAAVLCGWDGIVALHAGRGWMEVGRGSRGRLPPSAGDIDHALNPTTPPSQFCTKTSIFS